MSASMTIRPVNTNHYRRGGIFMKTSQLLLSGLDITEDEYSYKAQFILNAPGKSKGYEIGDLDSGSKLAEIKTFFNLEEAPDEIGKLIMDMVMEKANICSEIIEGENFEETVNRKRVERAARSFDLS
jgi:hypothetical protein